MLDAWITVQGVHAIANGLPVLVANRCGYCAFPARNYENSGINFWGNSFVYDPQAELLICADAQTESAYIAELD